MEKKTTKKTEKDIKKTNKKIEEKEKIIETLEAEKNELSEKLLRSVADVQNYRKRKDEELARMLKYSEEEIVLEILPIIDNFERAIKLDDDNLEDDLSKFLQGFKMIYSNLLNVLNKFEVKEIEAFNTEFNPSLHQAVLTDCILEKEDNIILEVLQKGYIYKDKVIRPAMVKVNKK